MSRSAYVVVKSTVLTFLDNISIKKGIVLTVSAIFYIFSALFFYFLAVTSRQEVSMIGLFAAFHLLVGIWFGAYYYNEQKLNSFWQLNGVSWRYMNIVKLLTLSLCFALTSSVAYYLALQQDAWTVMLNLFNTLLIFGSISLVGAFIAILINKITTQPIVRVILLTLVLFALSLFLKEIYSVLLRVESALFSNSVSLKFALFQLLTGFIVIKLLLTDLLVSLNSAIIPQYQYNQSPKHADIFWKSNNLFLNGWAYALVSLIRSKALARKIMALIILVLPLALVLRELFSSSGVAIFSVVSLIFGYVFAQESASAYEKIKPMLIKYGQFWLGVFSLGLIVTLLVITSLSPLLNLDTNSLVAVILTSAIFYSLYFGNFVKNNLINDLFTSFIALVILLVVILLLSQLEFYALCALLLSWFIGVTFMGIIRSK